MYRHIPLSQPKRLVGKDRKQHQRSKTNSHTSKGLQGKDK